MLVLFNRPALVRKLVGVLRLVRPARILAVADGPRSTHPGDHETCAAARRELEGIDWPCLIEREFSPSNLGCDRRMVSGLDWAFSRVDRAIILEDDVLPDPSFFPWTAAMLDRFSGDPGVAMISGWNPLGYWGVGHCDHLRARSGGIWGWATTTRGWYRTNSLELGGDPAKAIIDAARPGADPLLAEHYGFALRSYRNGEIAPWDVLFALRNFLLGSAAIVPPVNLVRNTGIGPDATRTWYADDFRALIPVGTAAAAESSGALEFDGRFDRAALLVQLMARCIDPPMARRLAGLLRRGTKIPFDDAIRHHLAPFAVPDESLGILEHLAAQGVASPQFDRLLQAIRDAAPTDPWNP